MLFVVAIWAVRYAVKSNQFEDLDNASQRIILDDRQERRQVIQAHNPAPDSTELSNNPVDLSNDNASTIQKPTVNSNDSHGSEPKH